MSAAIEWDYDFVDACEFLPGSRQAPLKTPEQVKADFLRNGVSIGSWAKANGFRREHVYAVLDGRTKAKYGEAHLIAVALGMKDGVVGASAETFMPAMREAA